MVDWGRLSHAYGPAADVPALLARLSPEPVTDVWEKLWSRLCHQGTVYPASFAALPALTDAAARWKPEERSMVLALAGAILASDDVKGTRATLLGPVAGTVPRLRQLARESLSHPGWSRTDFIHLLQAARAFEEDQFWGQRLDGLVSGEFAGACPHCAEDLYLVIGEYGFFVAADEWVNRPETLRRPIESARGELPVVGRWLRDQAQAAGQVEVAEWTRYIFGLGSCPRCGKPFSVPDAIAAV